MTDIVERLRKYHREIVEIDGGECSAMEMTRLAADEIERLRALLRECVDPGGYPETYFGIDLLDRIEASIGADKA